MSQIVDFAQTQSAAKSSLLALSAETPTLVESVYSSESLPSAESETSAVAGTVPAGLTTMNRESVARLKGQPNSDASQPLVTIQDSYGFRIRA